MGQINSVSASTRRTSIDSIEPILQNSGNRDDSTNIISRFFYRIFGSTCRKRKRANDDSINVEQEQRSKIIRLDASTDTFLDTRDAATDTTDAHISSKDACIQTDAVKEATNGAGQHFEKAKEDTNGRKVDEVKGDTGGKGDDVGVQDFMDFPFLKDRRSILHFQVHGDIFWLSSLTSSLY